jgi:hypothetical protein
MLHHLTQFLRTDRGAVTVDWTVLSAAAVSMALATVTVLEDGIETLVARIDAELRSQQLSDGYVQYQSGDFEPLIARGLITAEDGAAVFVTINQLMNSEILTALELGIDMLEAGTLPPEDLPTLVALASVARQRDIASAEMLDYYFGFSGADPVYMNGV